MSDATGEYSMVRTYLELADRAAVEEPRARTPSTWRKRGAFSTRIISARTGQEAHPRYLAVRKLNLEGHGRSCASSAARSRKTSLGQSVAKALGRKFVRVSAGGVHDEAEIRGHRRTYIGALPGNIIQAIKKAATRNCVMMLERGRQARRGIHGDPSSRCSSARPAQNNTFRDNYLGVPYDLRG